jgi:hypothetical protein
VFERELGRFRAAIRAGEFEIATHAFEELAADGLTVLDLEMSVLTGRIVERQRDRTTGERKHVIEGRAVDGLGVTVVAKWNSLGRMKILTAYRTYE